MRCKYWVDNPNYCKVQHILREDGIRCIREGTPPPPPCIEYHVKHRSKGAFDWWCFEECDENSLDYIVGV